jgi:hypothetical protein
MTKGTCLETTERDWLLFASTTSTTSSDGLVSSIVAAAIELCVGAAFESERPATGIRKRVPVHHILCLRLTNQVTFNLSSLLSSRLYTSQRKYLACERRRDKKRVWKKPQDDEIKTFWSNGVFKLKKPRTIGNIKIVVVEMLLD